MCTLVPLTATPFGDQYAYNRAYLEPHPFLTAICGRFSI